MIYIHTLLITLITVIILDISGFYEEMYLTLKKWLTNGKFNNEVAYIKPFSCSFCMSWWINLAFIIISNAFSIYTLAYILGLSVLTPVIKEVVIALRNFLLKVICDIEDWFQLN